LRTAFCWSTVREARRRIALSHVYRAFIARLSRGVPRFPRAVTADRFHAPDESGIRLRLGRPALACFSRRAGPQTAFRGALHRVSPMTQLNGVPTGVTGRARDTRP
jgi:hypothetical protein